MKTKITHAPVLVLNQESAYDFYVNKLGFKVKLDLPMPEDGRWLTVYPPDQPNFEIILVPVARSFHAEETTKMLKKLLAEGAFGCRVFTCKYIFVTYEVLKQKVVQFSKAPTKEFYETEAIFKDDSGNWFSLAQLV